MQLEKKEGCEIYLRFPDRDFFVFVFPVICFLYRFCAENQVRSDGVSDRFFLRS